MQSDCKNTGVWLLCSFSAIAVFSFHAVVRRAKQALQKRSLNEFKTRPKRYSNSIAKRNRFPNRFGKGLGLDLGAFWRHETPSRTKEMFIKTALAANWGPNTHFGGRSLIEERFWPRFGIASGAPGCVTLLQKISSPGQGTVAENARTRVG